MGISEINLLLHFSFELAIDHNLLLTAHLRVEKFDSHVPPFDLEPPDVLLLGPNDRQSED